MFQLQIRPDTLPLQSTASAAPKTPPSSSSMPSQPQRGVRRKAAFPESANEMPGFGGTAATATAGNDMTPCRRARLCLGGLNVNNGGGGRMETATSFLSQDLDTYTTSSFSIPSNSNCKNGQQPAENPRSTNCSNHLFDGGNCLQPAQRDGFHQFHQQPQQRQKWSSPHKTMSVSGMEEKQSPPNHRLCMAAPPPVEPVLERSRLLGSSTSNNSSSSRAASMLTGSLSCANLAKICAVTPTSCCSSSCSSSALDQLKATECTCLFDHLFLGSQKDALDEQLLADKGITRVINLSENCPKPQSLPDEPSHFLRIAVNDTYSAKLLPFFETAFQFIEEAKKAGERVLLHCLAGISRSPTLAIAYVMRSKGMSNEEAYSFVKSRRPSISPNFNFLGQLWEYERQLRQKHILPPLPPPTQPTTKPVEEEPTIEKAGDVSPSVVNSNGKRPMLVNGCENGKKKETEDCLEQKPVARPRQLLGALNSRFSCPPTLIDNDIPSPGTFHAPSPPKDIPSPSTEFSRLDISLANPCFKLDQPQQHPPLPRRQGPSIGLRRKAPPPLPPPLFSASMMAENPVFGATLDCEDWQQHVRRLANARTRGMTESMQSVESGYSTADSYASSAAGIGGIGSAPNSATTSLCSSDSLCSASFSSSSMDEFGLNSGNGTPLEAAFSTRNCLADTDGDELVRLGGPTAPIIVGLKGSDSSSELPGDEQLECEEGGKMYGEERQPPGPPPPGFGGGEQQRKKQHIFGGRRCMLVNGLGLPNFQQQFHQKRHFHSSSNFFCQQRQSSCSSAAVQNQSKFTPFTPHCCDKPTKPLPAMSCHSSTPSTICRPKLAKAHCIDRLLAFGRRKRASTASSTQFRQSLPTIGDDRGQEEEEERCCHGNGIDEVQKGKIEEELLEDGKREKQQQQEQNALATPTPTIDPERSSISSASSLEIAVQ